MYDECDSLTSRHRITLDQLTCHKNPAISQDVSMKRESILLLD